MIEFVWPHTNGEWLAWSSALIMLVVGIVILFAPRKWINFLGLGGMQNHPENKSLIRGPIGGYYVGISIVTLMLHPQPLIYLALGAAFIFGAFGRFLSMLLDASGKTQTFLLVLIELVLGLFPIAYVFGYIS